MHLYHIGKDIGESKDVGGEQKDVADRLEGMALEWYRTLPRESEVRTKQPVPKTEAEANRLPVGK